MSILDLNDGANGNAFTKNASEATGNYAVAGLGGGAGG